MYVKQMIASRYETSIATVHVEQNMLHIPIQCFFFIFMTTPKFSIVTIVTILDSIVTLLDLVL